MLHNIIGKSLILKFHHFFDSGFALWVRVAVIIDLEVTKVNIFNGVCRSESGRGVNDKFNLLHKEDNYRRDRKLTAYLKLQRKEKNKRKTGAIGLFGFIPNSTLFFQGTTGMCMALAKSIVSSTNSG